VNPIQKREAQKAHLQVVCKKCKDFGFTGDVPAVPGGSTAKDVFERGIPCSCDAGQDFARMQKEWLKPD
jgi:hypothetical protein